MGYGSKSPEPSSSDISRAAASCAKDVFDASDGRLTVAFYRRLQAIGHVGHIAVNLFRAQKTSSRAKAYRRGRYRAASYDAKNYSLDQLVTCLRINSAEIEWGWAEDPNTPNFEWILYVDLPTGQVSFHSPTRLLGPDYPHVWDRSGTSEERILAFVDAVLNPSTGWTDSVRQNSQLT